MLISVEVMQWLPNVCFMRLDTMEKYIENLVAAGIDRANIVRARHRGIAFHASNMRGRESG